MNKKCKDVIKLKECVVCKLSRPPAGEVYSFKKGACVPLCKNCIEFIEECHSCGTPTLEWTFCPLCGRKVCPECRYDTGQYLQSGLKITLCADCAEDASSIKAAMEEIEAAREEV